MVSYDHYEGEEADGGSDHEGIDFIEALSDKGDQDPLLSQRELISTKVRIFGPEPTKSDDKSDDDSFELAEGVDPGLLVRQLRAQLKVVKKVYSTQVVNSMKIVKKLRQVHLENK